MKIRNLFFLFAIILAVACSSNTVDITSIYFVANYDSSRDPFADVESAIQEAKNTNRNILLEIGGDWCSWCHILDRFVSSNKDIADVIEQNFVVVKVNVSEENYNDEFMEQYPFVTGYPHFFILDNEGELVHSQDTAKLEEGQSYNHDVFLAFLEDWKPNN
jgi:thioredoxin-related protein